MNKILYSQNLASAIETSLFCQESITFQGITAIAKLSMNFNLILKRLQ